MHDLDRVMFELGESEMAGESPHHEFMEVLGEFSGPAAHETNQTAEQSAELSQQAAQSQETYELELATELLGVNSEAELEEFLGNLLSSAAGAVRGFANSPTGQQLGGILKQAAKQALPVIGGAVGDWASPGGRGASWGRRIGSGAGDLFGLEFEGLSHEDRELEVARAFVRFANAATEAAARGRGTDPRTAALRAAASAARQHAPGIYARLAGGLISDSDSASASGTGTERPVQGKWVRRGPVIVLYGL